jgi:hypothetical protein
MLDDSAFESRGLACSTSVAWFLMKSEPWLGVVRITEHRALIA